MFADSKFVTSVLNEARDYLAEESGYGVQMAASCLDSLEAHYGIYAKDKERIFKMREKIAEASWACYERNWDEREEWD